MRKKSWNLVYILAKKCRISSFNLTIFRFWFLVRIWYFHWNISIQTFRIPPKLLDFQVKSTLYMEYLLEFWLENQKKSLEFFREFFHKLIFLLTQRCWGTFKDCLQVKRASALSNCIFNIFVRIFDLISSRCHQNEINKHLSPAYAPKYLDFLQYKENSSRSILIPDGVVYFWDIKIISLSLTFLCYDNPIPDQKSQFYLKSITFQKNNISFLSFRNVQIENFKLKLELKVTLTNITEKLSVMHNKYFNTYAIF